jgi:hypothetical protein
MRFTGGDILRFLSAHLAGAVGAGLAFMLARAVLAIPSIPDVGVLALTWYLATVQASIVGGAAGIAAVLLAARLPQAAALAFVGVGIVTGVALSAVVDQVNLTFALPAACAGAVYGLCLQRFGWRKAKFAP